MFRARTLLVATVLTATAAVLGGCGFTPLYAAPGVVPKLAAINIVQPQGRAGYLISQHLEDAFAKDHSQPAKYSIRMSLGEARYPRGIRTDNVATRYEYVLTADYTLTNLPAGDVAKRGRVRVEVTYDSADQPYASVVAQQEAQDRATEEAARRIQLELAAWMATGEPTAKTKQKVTPPPADSATPTGLPTGS